MISTTYRANSTLPLTARDGGTVFGETSEVAQLAARRGISTHAQQTPWGDSGTILDPNFTAFEMTRRAGFDFEIGYRPVYYGEAINQDGKRSGTGELVHVPNQRALVNERDGVWLSQMSDGYVAVQPREIMRFYHDLACTHNVKLEAAGVVDHGKVLWAYASTGKQYSVGLGDKSELFLLFITSTDGQYATRVYLSAMRFKCFNQIGALGREGGLLASLRHNRKLDTEELKNTFASIDAHAEKNAEMMNRLASYPMTFSDAREYFRCLSCQRDDFGRIIENPRLDKVVEDLMERLRYGEGSEYPGSQNTAYGALQAVLHRHDHGARRRSSSSRFATIMYGEAAKAKTRALNLALDLID